MEKEPKKEKSEAGKGDKPRPVRKNKYDEGYSEIKWKSKKKENKDE